jgi:hypothetical protein
MALATVLTAKNAPEGTEAVTDAHAPEPPPRASLAARERALTAA